MSDVGAIAALCRRAGVPLLVDNAHGAHLRFTPRDEHPIALGATLCCDSAHKTLPVLTGGGYLHAARDSGLTKAEMKAAMALFGSTSPSYLILLSLDLCNRYLAQEAHADFSRLAQDVQSLETFAAGRGFPPIAEHRDLTKITFDAYTAGMTGEELAEHFRRYGIECEYAAQRHMVLMLSPQNPPRDFARIRECIAVLPQGDEIFPEDEAFTLPEPALSIREASFAPREKIQVERAFGRIAAETRIKCPPGVPVVIAGEKIGKDTQKLLKKSSFSQIYVVK